MTKQTPMEMPCIYNAEQLAEILQISRARAYQLLNSSDFPTLKIGKRKLVPKDKLMIWIDQQTEGETQKRA